MSNVSSFILRNHERGYNKILSQMLPSGADQNSAPAHSTYLAGHPDTSLERYSSFNFHEYQKGMEGFGKLKVFGDEIFSPNGCGYNMHPHHNFIIMAFVLKGSLVHINTIGKIDVLNPGDYYIFSAGSGGKHCELNIDTENALHVIYVWIMPDKLYAPPSYLRNHFNAEPNKVVPLIGNHIEGALAVEQDFKVSRLVGDKNKKYVYKPSSEYHGMYFFVLEGGINIRQDILERRDSMGLYGVTEVEFEVMHDHTDLLIIETAM